MNLLVARAGYLTSVQDLGRTHHRHIGVSVGGALDNHALRVANLLVGNEPPTAGLEVALGGLQLRFADERLIAWCGGDFEAKTSKGILPPGHVACVTSGEELLVRPPASGGRAWFAVAGGVDVPCLLDSRSTDLRSGFGGLGGRRLRDGDTLALAPLPASSSRLARTLARTRLSSWSAPHEWSSTRPRHPFLRIVRGADWSRFVSSERDFLVGAMFTVGADTDRMGVRLAGPVLSRSSQEELLSETVTAGTIQIPPNGSPIVLLGDCQTIGGYPKIAHVITVDLAAAAQLMPGDAVRFREVSLPEAQLLLHERERDLAWFRAGLALKMV